MEHHEEDKVQRALLATDLEGERGAWIGGEVGVGARRWGYRSQGTRFALQLGSFLLVLVPCFYVILTYMGTKDDVPPSVSWARFVELCLMVGIIMALSWLWFSRAAILADKEGLEVRSPFYSPRRAAWADIEGLEHDAWGEFVRTGSRKLYIRHFFPPVRLEELRAHIQEHIDQ